MWVWADIVGQNAQIKENEAESIFTTHMVSDFLGKKYYTGNYSVRISIGHPFVFSYSRLLSWSTGLIFFLKKKNIIATMDSNSEKYVIFCLALD